MKRVLFTLLAVFAVSVGTLVAQDENNGDETPATASPEELQEAVNGLGERATLLESEVEKLKMVKVSGYVQAEWQHFDQNTSVGGRTLTSNANRNLFTIRRGRIKVQHKLALDMLAVVQADVTETGVRLKDAYLTYNILPNDELSFTVGAFNRPNYEVELSSSARESVERAQVTRAFYPDERDLGLMFTYQPAISYDFVPKLQLGIFNGTGIAVAESDPYKDIITRLTFPIPFGSESPVQVDLGASLYMGGIPQIGDSITKWEGEARRTVFNDATGTMRGMGNRMNFNVEGQIYLDVLPFGGTILKGEFMNGKRPTAPTAATAATVGTTKDTNGVDIVKITPGTAATNLAIRNQTGMYVYFVQNIGAQLQFALKYDAFDRNTDLSGANVKSTSDVNQSVIGVGLNYFVDNIRLSLWYDMPKYAADEVVAGLEDLKDNKTTIRFQYKY